jgi:hypothetical protein
MLSSFIGSPWVASASAQNPAGAASLQIPPDARTEAMGRAFAPLERNAMAAWSNPGALGLVKGLDARAGTARLVPTLADDVLFDYQSVVMSVEVPGERMPLRFSFGFNHTGLSYGATTNATESTLGGTFAIGIGDLVGVGIGVKHFKIRDLYVGGAAEFSGGSATAIDYGILARSPEFPFRKDDAPESLWSVTLTGAMAWSNRGGDIDFDDGFSDPLPRIRRESLGIEFDILPARQLFPTDNPWLGRILEDVHLVSVAAALGRDDSLLEMDIPDSVLAQLSRNEREGIRNYRGLEVSLLDSFSMRWGHTTDEAGQIEGNTRGWGLSLLGLAGVDYARIPQFETLGEVAKWSFWIRVPLDPTL